MVSLKSSFFEKNEFTWPLLPYAERKTSLHHIMPQAALGNPARFTAVMDAQLVKNFPHLQIAIGITLVFAPLFILRPYLEVYKKNQGLLFFGESMPYAREVRAIAEQSEHVNNFNAEYSLQHNP